MSCASCCAMYAFTGFLFTVSLAFGLVPTRVTNIESYWIWIGRIGQFSHVSMFLFTRDGSESCWYSNHFSLAALRMWTGPKVVPLVLQECLFLRLSCPSGFWFEEVRTKWHNEGEKPHEVMAGDQQNMDKCQRPPRATLSQGHMHRARRFLPWWCE